MGQTEVIEALEEARKTDKKGEGWLSMLELCERLGVERHSVSRSVRRLIVYGFLDVRVVNFMRGKREYRLREKYLRGFKQVEHGA